jgi:hypothetical protein
MGHPIAPIYLKYFKTQMAILVGGLVLFGGSFKYVFFSFLFALIYYSFFFFHYSHFLENVWKIG